MAVKKTPPKKKAPPAKKDKRVIVIRTEEVSLKELNVFHKNPNVGNVDLIAKSLHINGLFRPIVVNVGTHTGRPNEILAGNHTYLAARKPLFWKTGGQSYDKPAWSTILCSFVDVDEQTAAAIVAVDNKAAQEGRVDDEALFELLKGYGDALDLDAIGFKESEWEGLADKFKPEELPDMPTIGLDDEDDDDDDDMPDFKPPSYDETPLGDEDEATGDAPDVRDRAVKGKGEDDDEDSEDPEGAGIEITLVDDEIKGAFDLKDFMYFDQVGYWQLPKLRKDMLAQPEDIPEGLTTWAGSATKYDDDPDTFWLYNYGVDSTSGMKDVSKCIVSFYTFDEYFEPIWFNPKKFVGKVINSGIKMILSVDFSDDNFQGRAFNIYQLYRARWLARYFQEAGLKLIPNISYPEGDEDFLENITLPTLPKNIPVIAMQLQTINKDFLADDERRETSIRMIQKVIDTIQPKMLLLYAGQPGYDYFLNNIKYDGDIKFLLNRQAKLSVAAKGRKKKDTL